MAQFAKANGGWDWQSLNQVLPKDFVELLHGLLKLLLVRTYWLGFVIVQGSSPSSQHMKSFMKIKKFRSVKRIYGDFKNNCFVDY